MERKGKGTGTGTSNNEFQCRPESVGLVTYSHIEIDCVQEDDGLPVALPVEEVEATVDDANPEDGGLLLDSVLLTGIDPEQWQAETARVAPLLAEARSRTLQSLADGYEVRLQMIQKQADLYWVSKRAAAVGEEGPVTTIVEPKGVAKDAAESKCRTTLTGISKCICFLDYLCQF